MLVAPRKYEFPMDREITRAEIAMMHTRITSGSLLCDHGSCAELADQFIMYTNMGEVNDLRPLCPSHADRIINLHKGETDFIVCRPIA